MLNTNNQLSLDSKTILMPNRIFKVGVNTLGCNHKISNLEIANRLPVTAGELYRKVEILVTSICANRYGCDKCMLALKTQLNEREKQDINYSEPVVGGPANVNMVDTVIGDVKDLVKLDDDDYRISEIMSKRLNND